jgi:hypothetical protein
MIMPCSKKALTLSAVAAAASFSLIACSSAKPRLVTPQQAQDSVYDHRSRAEAARMTGNRGAAREHRAAARRYQHMMEEGRTVRPDQALARGAWHRQRAEAYHRQGYTRFVSAELEAAEIYEDFAVAAGGVPPEVAERRAAEYRERAQAYRHQGLHPFAEHYGRQAAKLESVADSAPRATERSE